MADMPLPGDGFTDARGRVMHVRDVRPGDPLGREVVGLRALKDGMRITFVPYACPLTTWAAVWRDKVEPLPVEQMKIG